MVNGLVSTAPQPGAEKQLEIPLPDQLDSLVSPRSLSHSLGFIFPRDIFYVKLSCRDGAVGTCLSLQHWVRG